MQCAVCPLFFLYTASGQIWRCRRPRNDLMLAKMIYLEEKYQLHGTNLYCCIKNEPKDYLPVQNDSQGDSNYNSKKAPI